MRKVLFSAHVDSHILNFHIPFLKWFKEQGYEVHVASNGTSNIPYVDVKYNIPFERSPLKLANLKSYHLMKNIINQNNYTIIHCHTPVGGIITRLASKNVRKKEAKILYTAHGFHFYKGAPIINWLLYYPIEKLAAKNTDHLITINFEDYNTAKNGNFRAEVHHIHGIGVDEEKFLPVDALIKVGLRAEYNYMEDEFILLCIGELNDNKNQAVIIKSLKRLESMIPRIRLIFAGIGPNETNLKQLVFEYGLQDKVDFLGFRKDINKLIQAADIVVSASIREGLGLNIIEAMLCNKPVIASKNRGHNELVKENKTGLLFDAYNHNELSRCIKLIFENDTLRLKMEKSARKSVNSYTMKNVMEEMKNIYNKLLL